MNLYGKDGVALESFIKIPSFEDIIHKDECMYCFDNQHFPGGIFVCLSSWDCFCERHITIPKKCGYEKLFLNISAHKKHHDNVVLSKIGIGMDGGYNPWSEYDYVYNICYVDENFNLVKKLYIKENFPKKLVDAVEVIVNKCSTETQMALLNNYWDGEQKIISKHSDGLLQIALPNNYISPIKRDIQCECCNIKENLWLNLTDGKIFCGRKYFDGSGGNNHAKEHYNLTKYPLVVKLGTISKTGADVFSYDEDEMVIDLNLEKHLRHFGIDMNSMIPTEKTISELTLEANKNLSLEDSSILENGVKLEIANGPGLTGIGNLGNSCYISSVFQLLCTIEEFKQQFNHDPAILYPVYTSSHWYNPLFQIYKLVYSLECGRYSSHVEEETNKIPCPIKPYSLKNALCGKKSVFHDNNQHDAMEFFLHLMNMMESLKGDQPVVESFQTDIRHFFEYKTHNFRKEIKQKITNGDGLIVDDNEDHVNVSSEVYLNLTLDIDNALSSSVKNSHDRKDPELSEKDKIIRKFIPWNVSLNHLLKEHIIETLDGSLCSYKSRFHTFPKYLIVLVCRYSTENEHPVKLDYDVEMPNLINLNLLNSQFLGTVHTSKCSSLNNSITNDEILKQLLSLGFDRVLCENALIALPNADIDMAVNWIIENQNNPDAFKPSIIKTTQHVYSKSDIDSENVSSLLAMGFDWDMANKALFITSNDIEAAVTLLLSDQNIDKIFQSKSNDNPPVDIRSDLSSTSTIIHSLDTTFNLGSDVVYHLKGFISHVGCSTHFGHYVCHAIKNGQFYLFNDDSVAKSLHPPINLGYIYLYERQL